MTKCLQSICLYREQRHVQIFSISVGTKKQGNNPIETGKRNNQSEEMKVRGCENQS